jgi:hypothetical protein
MKLNSKLLFLIACIPSRIFLSIIPLLNINSSIFYLIFGLILFLISSGFLYLYFTNKRLDAMEAGGYTWWHQLRLFHGLIYLCASIYILYNLQNKNFIKYASIPLFIDVIIGLCAFIYYRFII